MLKFIITNTTFKYKIKFKLCIYICKLCFFRFQKLQKNKIMNNQTTWQKNVHSKSIKSKRTPNFP